MDFGSVIGITFALGFVLLGAHMEHISMSALMRPTAAMIVLGGTAGAVILQFPVRRILDSIKGAVGVFFGKKRDPNSTIVQIVEFAKRARREGILALEKEITNVEDPFLAKALRMAVDGLEPKTLLETMETELSTIETGTDYQKKVWEAAGGYAPTVGILGAVLGLIHVMSNLSDPEALGPGIATAFVATIYGVGAANLVFLPFANKIAFNGQAEMVVREVELKGVMLIQEGVNHTIIEEQLKSFLDDKTRRKYEAKYGDADKKK